ncbi:MAG: penicillin-binding protein 2 [Rhodobacteraceae bacterium]|nr:penicillin-binding protein 2 [Paracoccaceae bacterium]
MLGGVQVVALGGLALRMRDMQVDDGDAYRLLAEENRVSLRLIPPPRGQIFDRAGVLVAGNEQNWRVTLVREDAGDVDAVLARIAHLLGMEPADVERARTEIARHPPFVPVTVADRLTWEQMSAIAVNAPALPGVTPEVGLSRIYPLQGDFAHVAGYVGPVSEADLARIENPDPLLRLPRFPIGKVGVEGRAEDVLRGTAGTRQIEVNAGGRMMRELSRVDGTPGADLQLTIDAGLQNYVQARMGEESASCIVMDCDTGDLLAMASAPSFDPNLFVRGISTTDFSVLMENDHRPLATKTVQGTYPPGSTFKMLVALAGLEAGLVTPNETVFCPGHLQLGDRRFHCWKGGGHGRVDMVQSIAESCDVYYYEIAQKVGIERIAAMARRFGLGERFDLPLSGIAEGLIPSMEWKRTVRGESWLVGDTLNASIGQGFVLSSPIQLAVMTARLATGRAVVPRIIKSVNGVEQPVGPFADMGLNENHLRLQRRGMFEVTNVRRGTAYGSRIAAEEYAIAGKTGTSQVRNISVAERARGVIRNDQLPWNRRDHALFVGYAPADAPRVACAVVVEHGGGGSAAAAPIARDAMVRALHGDVPPLSIYPAAARPAVEALHRTMPLRQVAPPATGGRTRA